MASKEQIIIGDIDDHDIYHALNRIPVVGRISDFFLSCHFDIKHEENIPEGALHEHSVTKAIKKPVELAVGVRRLLIRR